MWNGFDLLHLLTGMWILIEPQQQFVRGLIGTSVLSVAEVLADLIYSCV